MRLWLAIYNASLSGLLISYNAAAVESFLPANTTGTNARTFAASGIVKELNPENQTMVIQHDAISNYMAAMTMSFKVSNQNGLSGLRAGDKILFQLHVTDTGSWVDQIIKIGTVSLMKTTRLADSHPTEIQAAPGKNPLLDYKFTNELDQAVSLNSFHGQALAVTFFFTRCPLPEFCPRLSKKLPRSVKKNSLS